MTVVQLFLQNEKLVYHMLNKFDLKDVSKKLGYNKEDWISVGRMALWKASKEYATKNINHKFSTIACCQIRNALCDEIRKCANFESFTNDIATLSEPPIDETLYAVKEITGEKDYNILLDYYGYKCDTSVLKEKYNLSDTQLKRKLNTLPRKLRKELNCENGK